MINILKLIVIGNVYLAYLHRPRRNRNTDTQIQITLNNY